MALKEALVKVLSHARWLLLPLAAALMMLAYAPPASPVVNDHDLSIREPEAVRAFTDTL